jgi:spermidine synthase
MEILGRFEGRNGQITIAQERKTGARLYVEEGVKQSYVLPGGSAGLDYVRLMVRVLEGAPDIILFGCGGGALASELCNRGCRVTVVDDNPISFEIARRYFWMPASVLCVADGMVEFLEKGPGEYAAIGVDVGGPSFDYESTLTPSTCALLGRRLANGGRVAINIARDWAQDATLMRTADRLCNEGLGARIFEEAPRKGRSALIVATKQATAMSEIAAIASSLGFRAPPR